MAPNIKIAIYGFNKFGTFVGNQITESFDSDGQLLYIDNDQIANNTVGVNVINLDVFETKWRYEVETVLVCALNYKARQEMVKSLIKVGFRNIYIVDNNVWYGKLPLFDNDGRFFSYVERFEEVKPILPYLEYHVTDYCNLKCDHCGHHSNEVKKLSFASLRIFEEALMGLAEKFESIETVRLLGGEPLLASNIHEYADLVLKLFPMCKVKIVTNGLLLTKMKMETLEYLSTHRDIEIQVTQYPPTRKLAEEIIACCKKKKITMTMSSPIEYFNDYGEKSAFENEPEAMMDKWKNCYLKDCHFLREHRLYFCIKCWVEEEFFGKNMEKASVNIVDDNINGWEILSAIESPFYVCAYCQFSFPQVKWSAPGHRAVHIIEE